MRAFCYRVAAILAVLAGVATLEALSSGALSLVVATILLGACGLLAWRLLRRERPAARAQRQSAGRAAHGHKAPARPAPLRLAENRPTSRDPNAA